ncbi:MAG: tRNA (adenosine(37)-N6)-dimethylallyltransferase MiaA [Ruminococcaceae bacterium]|nr:tRNA (adenosine(37)-N6)-dimethylallyltransferase MiaA [Oscillospiraceae bacterium]
MTKIKTVSILGPTASGKTGLAIALAKKIGGEVVSCDSMQLYRTMDIGTATPTMEERGGVVHHMFDIIDPADEYSAADYARDASDVIADIASRGKVPILCGGTGMYHDSLMKITSFTEGERDEALRDELYRYAAENGNEALHERLRAIDPEAAENIHPNNVKRVVRALEVFETTGKTKTETDREQTTGEVPYDNTVFILDFADRALLYSRIEKRVDIMMQEGLEDEARRILLESGDISRTAAQAIGYKEFLPYFNGEGTIEDVSASIKLATRHYAKRQLIWFRRYSGENIFRLVPDTESGGVRSASSLADEAYNILAHRNIEKNKI